MLFSMPEQIKNQNKEENKKDKIDKETKLLLVIFLVACLVSIGFTYHRYIVEEDFNICTLNNKC